MGKSDKPFGCVMKSQKLKDFHFKYTFPRLKGVDSEEGAEFPRWEIQPYIIPYDVVLICIYFYQV